MAKSITLVTQDFYPMKGGIARYLMQVYRKYFFKEKFQVVVPDNIGQIDDYADLPFKVYQTKFFPFELNTDSRTQANRLITRILIETDTEVVLFGYLRSHPEVSYEYKKHNSFIQTGIITHAKEVFIEDAIVNENKSPTGAHKGYTRDEATFYKRILEGVDNLFCVSQFTRDILVRQGINANFHLLYPSINISKPLDKNECRSVLGYSPEDFVVLSVGRLINRKGQDKVLSSIINLQERLSNIKYDIVGDGPNRTNLQNMIIANNLEGRVYLNNKVEDNLLAIHYGAADIFVLPTDYIPPNDVEGFGIVFLEAGMYQLPVIGGKTGGVIEAVVDKETGYLIDPKSSNELESKIIDLYNNPELRIRMGKQARTRVISEFNDLPSDYLTSIFS